MISIVALAGGIGRVGLIWSIFRFALRVEACGPRVRSNRGFCAEPEVGAGAGAGAGRVVGTGTSARAVALGTAAGVDVCETEGDKD